MQYLIEKISQGDHKAFKKFFESFFIPLCSFAKRYDLSDDVAEDLSQEALLKYWQRRTNFNNFNQVRSFLYTTVRNAAFNELQHMEVIEKVHLQLSETLPMEEPDIHNAIVEEEVYRQLRDAILLLPKRSREIMLLTLTGLSNDEIAEELNIAKETVRSLKKIAHKKLRDRIQR
ncbi:MAG: sigma-70 family RNA polymerase sigma factor [Dysgonamonadaceae bacterium]|jgi:RNA polymerase sigma-70 factor (ECF subfamily)|nr:sigma-70 family RNA polymerase sigma factor [Dysgonamonadaceae bacterium]